ncbi:hypothetical protein GFM00_17980 [Rhizobium leguminosarum bv. viciae]|nr:hypothetical protein [Rhizobium leguminosarum bv. viciae]
MEEMMQPVGMRLAAVMFSLAVWAIIIAVASHLWATKNSTDRPVLGVGGNAAGGRTAFVPSPRRLTLRSMCYHGLRNRLKIEPKKSLILQ